MGDLLYNSCSKSVLKELNYAWRPVLINVAGHRFATLLRFTKIHKDFDHTVNLILARTAILKNIYFFYRTSSPMAASAQSLNSND